MILVIKFHPGQQQTVNIQPDLPVGGPGTFPVASIAPVDNRSAGEKLVEDGIINSLLGYSATNAAKNILTNIAQGSNIFDTMAKGIVQEVATPRNSATKVDDQGFITTYTPQVVDYSSINPFTASMYDQAQKLAEIEKGIASNLSQETYDDAFVNPLLVQHLHIAHQQ